MLAAQVAKMHPLFVKKIKIIGFSTDGKLEDDIFVQPSLVFKRFALSDCWGGGDVEKTDVVLICHLQLTTLYPRIRANTLFPSLVDPRLIDNKAFNK